MLSYNAQPDITQASEQPAREVRLHKPITRWFDPPASDHVLLRAAEVGAWIGVAKSTLHLWRKTKRGPRFVRIEGYPRYLSGEVRAWICTQAGQEAPK